jgi:predicted RND superfamily exporter protein
MIRRLAREQLRHPWLFLTTIVVIVALLLSVALQLQLNSQLDALIPDDGEFNSNERLLATAFGNSAPYLIVIKNDDSTILQNAVVDLRDPRVLEYTQELESLLSQSQYVDGFGGLEISEQGDLAKFTVFVRTPDRIGGAEAVKEEIEFFMAKSAPPPGTIAQLTGFNLVINRVSELLIQDNLLTVILTTVFIFFFLLWYFKSVRFVLAVLLSPLIALVALAAIMVMLDIAITIPLAAVGVLVLGLGVDYGIHIAIHYKHERQDGKSNREALYTVMDELAIPITASFLTTLAGFAALLFGVSPSTQDQGAVLSIAISIIFLVSFLIFPVFLTLLVRDKDINENKFFGKIKRGLAKLAVYQARHPWPILIIFGIITVVMFVGMTRVEFSTSNSNWIPEQDPISVSFREEAYAFGDEDAIILIFKATANDLRSVQKLMLLRQRLQELFWSCSSLALFMLQLLLVLLP